MNAHAPRPMAMHDTTDLKRHERGERIAKRVFFFVLPLCVAGLAYLLRNGL